MADDDESLDEILSGPAKPETAPQPEPEAEPKPDEPLRDEHGRFAPKEEEQPEVIEKQPEGEQQPEPEAESHPPGFVPHSRFHAVNETAKEQRERADRLEALLAKALQAQPQAAPQPQAEPVKPPEFWENPEAFLQHALTPYQQQIAEMTFRTSRAEAYAEFGKDTVTAAEAAMKAAIESGQLDRAALKASLAKSGDPVGDVVRWHQSSPAVQEASIREKLRAELMAEFGIDPNKQPAPSPTPSSRDPVVRLPPSLSKVPAGHAAPERDESLDEVLSAPRRRA